MSTRKRGKGYLADFMVAGKRYREPFKTEAEATAYELTTRAAIMQGQEVPKRIVINAPPVGSGTLGAILDYLLTDHWEKLPRSLKTNKVNIGLVKQAFGKNTHMRDITAARLKEFVSSQEERGSSGSTINRKLAILSKAMTYAVDNQHITVAPSLPYQKPGAPRTRTITPDEEARITNLFARWSEPDMVDFTTLGIETGLRLSELLAMEWTSVADNLSRWKVEKGKTRAAIRTVALSPSCRNALVDLRKRHPDEVGPLSFMKVDFENRWRDLWDRMRRSLELEDVVIHVMRHTCATRLCAQCRGREDLDLVDVQKWMGHSNISQTQKYVHPDDDAMDRLMEQRELNRPAFKAVA
jgi:integrase